MVDPDLTLFIDRCSQCTVIPMQELLFLGQDVGVTFDDGLLDLGSIEEYL